jgi:uncharacterized protein YjbI with pentapeptide repeats
LTHALLLAAALGAGLLGCWYATIDPSGAPKEAQATRPSLKQMDWRAGDLRGQDLEHGILLGTNLIDANLSGAILRGACLCYADLRRADLTGARLMHADLDYANLTDAKLFGTDLRHARLSRARLRGARYDRATRWPAGFDPRARGAIPVILPR